MKVTKAAAIAASTVALAMGAVACNDDGSGSGTANPPAASHAAGGSASGGSTGATGGSGGSGGAGASTGGSGGAGSAKPSSTADRCRPDELKAYIQMEPPLGNMSAGLLKLANVGKRTCDITGYPGLGGLLADNSQINLNTTRVPYPFPPTDKITIKPGDNAFAGMKWNSCDKGDTTCHVLGGLVVTPPDQKSQLVAELTGLDNKPVIQVLVSSAGITVGTLQPTVGVLFNS
ncbi:DUF4232 domain-containing protein [Kitasatospora viridis]|uniref:Uncharacterized protein DUF4232 n=1 Tax=Kitasatospora viridis TaxID=281105 RepID=A0A561ULN2_9ACTN|nr:DUF4232 domain-containing protein [Kitasatospora viridis]TWG00298.1 uncharacterized protein DUF4232 [Kitasatospora viridis]